MLKTITIFQRDNFLRLDWSWSSLRKCTERNDEDIPRRDEDIRSSLDLSRFGEISRRDPFNDWTPRNAIVNYRLR